jgi:hypothetical protein
MMNNNTGALKRFVDSDFLLKLEYHLSKSFKYSPDDNVKHFWCDGILIEENIYIESTIELEKQIIAKAWIGFNGQDIYKMVIKLGERSFERYLAGTDASDCMPDANTWSWFSIQPDAKIIEVRLN